MGDLERPDVSVWGETLGEGLRSPYRSGCSDTATTLVETPALFREWSLPSWGSGPWQQSRWLLRSGRGDVGEPVQPWAVWVPGTVRLPAGRTGNGGLPVPDL